MVMTALNKVLGLVPPVVWLCLCLALAAAGATAAFLWKSEVAAHKETLRAAAADAAKANERWATTLERRLGDQADAMSRRHAAELASARRTAAVNERIVHAPSSPLAACPAVGTALGELRERAAVEDRRPDPAAAGRAADVRARARRAGS